MHFKSRIIFPQIEVKVKEHFNAGVSVIEKTHLPDLKLFNESIIKTMDKKEALQNALAMIEKQF